MKFFIFVLPVVLAAASFVKCAPSLQDYISEVDSQHDDALRMERESSDLTFSDILKQIKEHIRKNVDPDLLKEKVEKLLGQGSELLEQLVKTLKEKGKKKLELLIDALTDDDDDSDARKRRALADYWNSRAFADYWDKVKAYFKDLKIDLKEKYARFGEWVRITMDKGVARSKDKMENIKAIAKEFMKHAKGVSKDIAVEAGEFFRNYKEELGIVYEEILERIKEIKEREGNEPINIDGLD